MRSRGLHRNGQITSNMKSLKMISLVGLALVSVGLGGMLLAYEAYPDSHLLGGWGLILGPIYWLGLLIVFGSVVAWLVVGSRLLWRKMRKRCFERRLGG